MAHQFDLQFQEGAQLWAISNPKDSKSHPARARLLMQKNGILPPLDGLMPARALGGRSKKNPE